MTTAQAIFSVALGIISLIIVAFAIYVVRTATWGDRWVRPGAASDDSRATEDK